MVRCELLLSFIASTIKEVAQFRGMVYHKEQLMIREGSDSELLRPLRPRMDPAICGLFVFPIQLSRPAQRPRLHLCKEMPTSLFPSLLLNYTSRVPFPSRPLPPVRMLRQKEEVENAFRVLFSPPQTTEDLSSCSWQLLVSLQPFEWRECR